jgi:hypothetical protein
MISGIAKYFKKINKTIAININAYLEMFSLNPKEENFKAINRIGLFIK